MSWFAVIKKASGEAVSFGDSIADPMPTDLLAIPIDHQPRGDECWDIAIRSVVPRPADPAVAKRERLAALRAKGWGALTLAEKDEARTLRFDLGGDPP